MQVRDRCSITSQATPHPSPLIRSDNGVEALISVISINSRIHTLNLSKAGVGSAGRFSKLESLCGEWCGHNVTMLLAECVGAAGRGCMRVRDARCRYKDIAGTYTVPKVVTIQEQQKGKAAAPPQEWKAVVGKLPATSVPPKTSKAAPAPKTAAPKNVKGGSDSIAAARKPLVSRN